jgi:UDP-2-acetamido-3-amino-2,3-dideoxy-glucuronate N-acetyltransferase
MTDIAMDFRHGKDFKYGSNVVIEPDVVVGDDVTLGHNIVLKSGTRFGNNINFADNCCTTGACILGDKVNVRTGSVISKAVIVEDCAYVGPGVMTNHTKHVTHCRPKIKSNFLTTRIGYGAVIGASCWLMAGINIGANVMIGGGVLVVKDLINPGIYIGIPPKLLKELPEELRVEGKSKLYNFAPEIIDQYLPGIK